MLREIDKAVALAQEFSGIGDVRALSDAETKALLEPWLGDGLAAGRPAGTPGSFRLRSADPSLLNLEQLRCDQVSADRHRSKRRRSLGVDVPIVSHGRRGGCRRLSRSCFLCWDPWFSVLSSRRRPRWPATKMSSPCSISLEQKTRFIAREFQTALPGARPERRRVGWSCVDRVFRSPGYMLTRQGTGQAGSDQLSALFGIGIRQSAWLLRRLRCRLFGRRPHGAHIWPRG
jgi:cell division transport system permease protein